MVLENKKAIITGSGNGIGKAIAVRLAKEGADIGVFDINGKAAEEVSDEIGRIGRNALSLKVDVGNRDEVRNAVCTVLGQWGQIDILVNNAGIDLMKNGVKVPVVEMPDEDWDRVIQVNLTGMFNICKACLPSMMVRRYGKIVNISSVAGKTGGFAAPIHYTASKAGVIGFTKSLAIEVAPYGINANVVMPSRVATRFGL